MGSVQDGYCWPLNPRERKELELNRDSLREASTEQEWTVNTAILRRSTLCSLSTSPKGTHWYFPKDCEPNIREVAYAHNSACSLLQQENKTLGEENDGMAAIIQRLEGKGRGEAATLTPQPDVAPEQTGLVFKCFTVTPSSVGRYDSFTVKADDTWEHALELVEASLEHQFLYDKPWSQIKVTLECRELTQEQWDELEKE